MTVEGIDVSVYQATMPSLAGRAFVFCRASIGQYIDSRYAQHAAEVRAAGRVLGAYHYVRKAVPAATQVDVFLAQAKGADLLALDLEGADGDATGKAVARDMIAALQATGRRIGLYHSLSGYPSLGQAWRWVAAWQATPPSIPWEFWQYRGSPLDLDRWHGDLASLQAFVQAAGGQDMPAIYQRDNRTGKAAVGAGAHADGFRLGATGWEKVKTASGPATWHFDFHLAELTQTPQLDHAYHLTDGPLAGLYARGSQVAATLDPVPPVPTPADLEAAKAAGYADAKAKAIAAVQAI